MLFQSASFLFVFLPIFLVVVNIVPKGTPKSLCILFFSYLFYSGSEPFFLLILAFSSLVDYFAALALARAQTPGRRRAFLILSVTVNLSLLGFYKYGGMVLPYLNPVLNLFNLPAFPTDFYKSFVLPAGISFYTFQSMSYTIDVYRGIITPERNLISYANYVAYLPQLIAGPIERFGHLHPQLLSLAQNKTSPKWSAGFDRMAVGIIEKLFLADSCSQIVDTLLQTGGPYNLGTSWAIAVGFGMQILFDFAGYTHMAIGISMLLGVELAENFLSPYKSRNIQDFWRRWHVTLSFWFRDYLYIPLGGSRKSLVRTVFNLMATFTLCGLWHGAGWNYLAWGSGHGLLLAMFHVIKTKYQAFKMPRFLGILLTFIAVHFLWILFRVNDPGQISLIWQAMLGLNGLSVTGVSIFDLAFLAAVTTFTLVSPNAAERWPGRSGPLESVAWWALALFAVFSSPQINQFIYFQFQMGLDMQEMDINRFGKRNRHTERWRWVGAITLALTLLTLEFTVGSNHEKQNLRDLAASSDNWAIKRFRDPTDTLPIPAKPSGVKRLAYISNSHAKTGGFVANHLQRLLEAVAPGRFEILDMSDPGIFAPDMLQRLLAGLDYDLDAIILPVAYISFSDRMNLARQAQSARSFLKPSIVHRLSLGFWLRNYDLSVYGQALVARYFRLYRYRNAIRDSWEQPVATLLKNLTRDKDIRFLEIDETLSWQFPTGFDQNLFDWSLYATGRQGHLNDMRDLVETCQQARLPVLACNLPIHWAKEPHRVNEEDFSQYRHSLETIFSTVLEFVDYQDIFPKEFTTYDALHPTWYGARLHALDLALRLEADGLLDSGITPQQILGAFLVQEQEDSLSYHQSLDGHYPPLIQTQLRRYDIFDPANARNLLRRLAGLDVGSQDEWSMVRQLGYRTYYWLNMPFDYTTRDGYPYPDEWSQALGVEIRGARERTEFFQNELAALQTNRLTKYPIPDLSGLALVHERPVFDDGQVRLIGQFFIQPGGDQTWRYLDSRTGRAVSLAVLPKGKSRNYTRIDLLGNGSFVLMQPVEAKLLIPQWVYSAVPYMNWGL